MHRGRYDILLADCHKRMFLSVIKRIERLSVWSRGHYLYPGSADYRNPICEDALKI